MLRSKKAARYKSMKWVSCVIVADSDSCIAQSRHAVRKVLHSVALQVLLQPLEPSQKGIEMPQQKTGLLKLISTGFILKNQARKTRV